MKHHEKALLLLKKASEDNEIEVPDYIKELDVLSPYAVEFRYDILPSEAELPFDEIHNLFTSCEI
jgi:hypothetical protein